MIIIESKKIINRFLNNHQPGMDEEALLVEVSGRFYDQERVMHRVRSLLKKRGYLQ